MLLAYDECVRWILIFYDSIIHFFHICWCMYILSLLTMLLPVFFWLNQWKLKCECVSNWDWSCLLSNRHICLISLCTSVWVTLLCCHVPISTLYFLFILHDSVCFASTNPGIEAKFVFLYKMNTTVQRTSYFWNHSWKSGKGKPDRNRDWSWPQSNNFQLSTKSLRSSTECAAAPQNMR